MTQSIQKMSQELYQDLYRTKLQDLNKQVVMLIKLKAGSENVNLIEMSQKNIRSLVAELQELQNKIDE